MPGHFRVTVHLSPGNVYGRAYLSTSRSPLRILEVCVYATPMTDLPVIRRGSLADRITRFLAANPDTKYRCYEIATGIRRKVQPVANECGRLARRGQVQRFDSEDRSTPTFYQHLSDPHA